MNWFARWWNGLVLRSRGICPKHFVHVVTDGCMDISWTYCPECVAESRRELDARLAILDADTQRRIAALKGSTR